MNTLINGLNRGLGFAIPSNMLREVGDQIIHAGTSCGPTSACASSRSTRPAENYGPIFSG